MGVTKIKKFELNQAKNIAQIVSGLIFDSVSRVNSTLKTNGRKCVFKYYQQLKQTEPKHMRLSFNKKC